MALFNELHEGVDIGAAIFAADDWLVSETCGGDFLAGGQLSVRLHCDGEGDAAVFGELVVGGDSVGGEAQERFVTVVIVHGFSLKWCR